MFNYNQVGYTRSGSKVSKLGLSQLANRKYIYIYIYTHKPPPGSRNQGFAGHRVYGSTVGCWLQVTGYLVTYWLPGYWIPGYWFALALRAMSMTTRCWGSKKSVVAIIHPTFKEGWWRTSWLTALLDWTRRHRLAKWHRWPLSSHVHLKLIE